VSADDGSHFTPKLHMTGVAGPIACAADATAAQCSGAAFQQLCQVLEGCGDGGIAEADAGVDGASPDASAIDAGPRARSEDGGASCGCSAVGGGHAVGAMAAIGAAAAAWGRKLARALSVGFDRPIEPPPRFTTTEALRETGRLSAPCKI
jgi:hypothetical protein